MEWAAWKTICYIPQDWICGPVDCCLLTVGYECCPVHTDLEQERGKRRTIKNCCDLKCYWCFCEDWSVELLAAYLDRLTCGITGILYSLRYGSVRFRSDAFEKKAPCACCGQCCPKFCHCSSCCEEDYKHEEEAKHDVHGQKPTDEAHRQQASGNKIHTQQPTGEGIHKEHHHQPTGEEVRNKSSKEAA